ncbi:translation initiation factor, putative (macronuclear) [Tetrahymena thermophila SB210]|uniref:Translation initiation factor, putative n=1 Tax=Tetrahymena thermophila (strain SB210) TaxID=312017 RepID=I7M682_TETTS|nr:translation initiation factor, putative [Tetrahymena thermophila SB210]EAR84624.2 translation initiation factor, putative [Tetrahymena thermophila SB210]|eukprot:XP_001032287.2 translation initiation factor, putative [Tetrahymena thermophila SB210]
MSSAEQQLQQNIEEACTAVETTAASIKVSLHLQGKYLLPLEIAPSDTLLEIRQFLSDSTVLYFFSNYHFVYQNQKLNEYVEFSTYNIQNDEVLEIKFDPFDEKTAKLHVKNVKEALANPQTLSNIFSNGEAAEQKQKNKRDSSDDDEEEEDKEENTTEQKANKNENKQKEKQESQQTSEQKNKEQYSLNDALQPSLSNKFITKELNPKKVEFIECISYINYSGFNPPPHYRKIQGDFFYLSVKTLENMSYHITASPQGFFVNKSNSKDFDPEPVNKNVKFVNLVELFQQISPLFKQNLLKMVQSETSSDELNMPLLSFYKYGNKWLTAKNNASEHEWNMNRCENSLINLYGFDVSGPRDWNEELQICRDLPKSDFIQRLNRDKANIKIQSEFIEAAIEGAKAVVEGNISALNPMDPPHQQVYVYNQIFFSFALENTDHFKQETGPDASPNVTTANCDLRNLKILHKLDIPGLSVLNTCLVDYKGHRVIAQSIIPGILNSDHSNCSQYGSIDDGKTICNNPEFEEIMKKICEHFHLDDEVKFYDENKKEYTLCGSIEVKGIRGSDRRKYILDLMRLSPRDVNYSGNSDNLCCTLRNELISNYVLSKNFEAANNQLKLQEQEEMNNKTESTEQTTEEKNKKGLSKFLKMQEYMQNPENQIKLKLNSNISTKAPLVEVPKLKDQFNQLQEIGEYLMNKAIPNVINDLISNSENGRISDSRSIEEFFHIHGVNMRYLGKVLNKISKKDSPHIYLILERVILVKAMKHAFREIMRNTASPYLIQALTHALNCIFSSPEVREKLEKGEIKSTESNLVNGDNNSESKKKKKGKKGKKTTSNAQSEKIHETLNSIETCQELGGIELALPEFLSSKPSDLWKRIIHIASKRYEYKLPENINDYTPLNLKFNRLATLRDLCLTIGVHIEAKDYEFTFESVVSNLNEKPANSSQSSQSTNQNSVSSNNAANTNSSKSTLPFQPENIKNITPIVKYIEINSDDSRANLEMGQKYLIEGKANEALECFHTAAHIILNLFGPIHKDYAYCFYKISNIYFKLGDYENAIHYQKQTIQVFKKLYGIDHHQTAQAISTLAYYYFSIKKYSLAYKNMFKSLFIYSLIGGEPHPDSFHTFMNLSLMFQENEQHQASLSCLFEALDRSITVYGKDHIKIAGCYQAVALAHYDIDDIKKAIEYQQKCVAILKLNLDAEDPRVKEALLFQHKFEKTLADKKKGQTTQPIKDVNNMRQFGTNKTVKPKAQEKIEDQQFQEQQQINEREILKQKLKYAKMNAKYGTSARKPYPYDINRIAAAEQENLELQEQTQSENNKKQQPEQQQLNGKQSQQQQQQQQQAKKK